MTPPATQKVSVSKNTTEAAPKVANTSTPASVNKTMAPTTTNTSAVGPVANNKVSPAAPISTTNATKTLSVESNTTKSSVNSSVPQVNNTKEPEDDGPPETISETAKALYASYNKKYVEEIVPAEGKSDGSEPEKETISNFLTTKNEKKSKLDKKTEKAAEKIIEEGIISGHLESIVSDQEADESSEKTD